MNLMTGLAWLAALRQQRPERRESPDLADMGTAFGLDASLAAAPTNSGTPPSETGHPETVAPRKVWRA